jgi:protein SCO1
MRATACLLLMLLALLSACGVQRPAFHSLDISDDKDYGGELRLRDHDGRPRSLADFRGKVVTVFFGYLNCPDFCPTHLARQKAVLQKLGPDAARVQTLFVSVDPERDTPERIKAYVTAFDPSFIGLTGSAEEIAVAARQFHASYQKVPNPSTPQAYSIDHSTLSMAFDPQGKLRLAIRHAESVDEVSDDLKLLLAGR